MSEQQQQVHSRCAIEGCLAKPYSFEDVELPVCVAHSDGTLCCKSSCTAMREGETEYCAKHAGPVHAWFCAKPRCMNKVVDGYEFCEEHCPTPVASQPEEVAPPAADVEEQVIVERKSSRDRDASPVRSPPKKRLPFTPQRASSAPPQCPPAPRKAAPPRRTSSVKPPYHPGDRLLFPTQRLEKRCRCGHELIYHEIDSTVALTQRWNCKGQCGFTVMSNLPKFVYQLKALNWDAWLPLEHTLNQLGPE